MSNITENVVTNDAHNGIQQVCSNEEAYSPELTRSASFQHFFLRPHSTFSEKED